MPTAGAKLLLTYCWARPHGGTDVFWIAAAPNAFAIILSDVIGLPAWVALVFVPLSLVLAHRQDREPDAIADCPHAP